MLPEHESIEAFATFLVDDDRDTFSFDEATELATALELAVPTAIRQLKAYGLSMVERPVARRVRGFTTSSHDRWFGPGSSRTHGGSGYEQIAGFSGQEG